MSADPMSSAEPKASAAPKRRWWRKKRWWAAAIPLALVAYVVSIGPAAYGMGRGWVSFDAYRTAYQRAEPCFTAIGGKDFYEVYATSCWLSGVKHRKGID